MRSSLQKLSLALVLGSLAACGGGGGGGSSFEVYSTSYAYDGVTPITVVNEWLVFFAQELQTGPTGTDINGDGDKVDQVAISVRMDDRAQRVIPQAMRPGIAAEDAYMISEQVWLVVNEAQDDFDWNGMNGKTDTVLVHWSTSALDATFVDTLNDETEDVPAAVVGSRLYYSSDDTPTPATDETSLRYIASGAPTAPVAIDNTAGDGPLSPVLWGVVDQLVMLLLDEVDEGRPLNMDGMADDNYVLGMLDVTGAAPLVRNLEYAVEDEDVPIGACQLSSTNWLVGFLVSETAEGTNLNDPALCPGQQTVPLVCNATPDVDTGDNVLFVLRYADYLMSLPDSLFNSCLAGQDRVVVVAGYVATLSNEMEANCLLNDDMDMGDTVVRYKADDVTVAPLSDSSQLFAIATGVSGGSKGLARLGNRFISVVSEDDQEDDIDGNPADHDLVGWLDPADATPTWEFVHQSGNSSIGTGIPGEPYAGASWMACEPIGGRLPLAFQEVVPDGSYNNNLDCGIVLKDSDTLDSLPVWCDFENGPTLDFDGVGFAVVTTNPGITLADEIVYFRVSEVDDNIDYNSDGMLDDEILMRNPETTCDPVAMTVASSVEGDVVVSDGDRGAAFVASEMQAGADLNDDGDMTDLVVQYFLL